MIQLIISINLKIVVFYLVTEDTMGITIIIFVAHAKEAALLAMAQQRTVLLANPTIIMTISNQFLIMLAYLHVLMVLMVIPKLILVFLVLTSLTKVIVFSLAPIKLMWISLQEKLFVKTAR